jgi:peptidoglycan hydrolase-like protein with peptidoglycan-binding domain
MRVQTMGHFDWGRDDEGTNETAPAHEAPPSARPNTVTHARPGVTAALSRVVAGAVDVFTPRVVKKNASAQAAASGRAEASLPRRVSATGPDVFTSPVVKKTGPDLSGAERPLQVLLAQGAKGPAVIELQVALERAGYSLKAWGADGSFGRETTQALSAFQKAQRLPVTGTLDARTHDALRAAGTARSPEYGQLFADGVLRTTLAVGYDEVQSHVPEVAKVKAGLSARGFLPLEASKLTAAERARLGLTPTDRDVFQRTFTRDGKTMTAVLQLVTPDMPDARARFVDGLKTDELVLYGGHGRYGSGPDFDDIHSTAGNFVIGTPSTPGKVTLGPNDLSRTQLAPGYQLLLFAGCNTFRYFDDLRAKAAGKSTASLDVIGSSTELYWDDTAGSLFAALDGVMRGDDADALSTALNKVNREGPDDDRRLVVTNGFADNP